MFERLIERLARGPVASRLPYIIIGGQAVLLYGEPRLTKDIDVTLGVGIEAMPRVLKLVRMLHLKILPKSAVEFVEKTMVLPLLEPRSGIRVDMIFSNSTYEKKAIQRAVAKKIGRSLVRFASVEDVVIHKVIAGRPIDIEDVRSILLRNPTYNSRYITFWLRKFDESLEEHFSGTFRSIARELKRPS